MLHVCSIRHELGDISGLAVHIAVIIVRWTHPAQQRDQHSLFIRDSFTFVINRTNPFQDWRRLWQAEFDHRFIQDDIRELLPSKLPRGFMYIQSCSGRPVYQELRSRHVNHHRNHGC